MKRIMILLLILSVFVLPFSAQAEKAPPRPILYTCYRQAGWGDRVEIGFVDSEGDLWTLTGQDGKLHWPYSTEDQLRFMENPEEKEFEKTGTLSHDDLFNLESLIAAVEESKDPIQQAANDAGEEKTYAVRYNREGEAGTVLLGISGDSLFENLDYNAQGLYLAARTLFPHVTSYAGDELMGPKGFIPVNITEFCGLGNLAGASVTAYYNDCEAGPRKIEMSREEQEKLIGDVMNSVVIGKVSAVETTGGFNDYYFSMGEQSLGRISVYEGLLYCSDGMYAIERTEP